MNRVLRSLWGLAFIFFGLLSAVVACRGGRMRLTSTTDGPDGIGFSDDSGAHTGDGSGSGDGGDGH